MSLDIDRRACSGPHLHSKYGQAVQQQQKVVTTNHIFRNSVVLTALRSLLRTIKRQWVLVMLERTRLEWRWSRTFIQLREHISNWGLRENFRFLRYKRCRTSRTGFITSNKLGTYFGVRRRPQLAFLISTRAFKSSGQPI